MGTAGAGGAGAWLFSWLTVISRGPIIESTARCATALPVPIAAPVTMEPMSPLMMPPPELCCCIIGGCAATGRAAAAGGGDAGAFDPNQPPPDAAGCDDAAGDAVGRGRDAADEADAREGAER